MSLNSAGIAVPGVIAALLLTAGLSVASAEPGQRADRSTTTISTDKLDYPPGHTVTFSGHGWMPGETVTIVLKREALVHDDEILTSVADGLGEVVNQDFAPADYDLGVTFHVIATGAASGRQALTTFTDAALTWTGVISTNWSTAGNWSSGTVPTSADDITIPANVASGRYPVVSTAAANAKTITLAAGAGTQPSLTVSANTLTVAGNFTINAGTVTHSGGTIAVTAGAVSVTGTLIVSGGTFRSSVTLTVNSGGNVNVSGSGVLHMANALATIPTDHIVIAAGGTLTQSGGSVNVRDLTTAAGTPAGTYSQSAGTFRMYHDFRNSGIFSSTGGTIEFAGNGGGNAFNAPGTNQFFNVVVNAGVSTDFSSNLAASILVRGDWTMNGTANLTGRASTVTFNGTGAQTIGGASSTTFRNVTVNKASGTVSLAGNQAVASGDLSVLAGTLDLSSFTMNRSAGGGTITVANGATLQIGGTNTFPSNYTTHTLGATSTVEYNGSAQTVTAESYGHLTLSGILTKTMPPSAMVIAGNFSMAGTAGATAGQALTVNGNFNLGSGTTFSAASFSHAVKRDFSNSGTFTAGTSTFTFNGTTAQTIGGSNSTTFNSLTINNSNGVALSGVDVTVGATLTFTSGNITTGSANRVSISAGGSVSRTSGHVVGKLRKNVATGATSRTFEVGDAGNYTPVSVSFASVLVAGDLAASTTAGDHPDIGSSAIDAAKSVNRYWTLSNSGISFTTYSATFTFVAGDIDAGATPSAFIVGKYLSGSWSTPAVGTRTGTTTQITGVADFGDFQIGESKLTTLGNGTDPAHASLAPGGAATMADAFSFQTSSGTDTITAVTITLAAGTSGGLALVEITDDAGTVVYGSVANPVSDTPTITLSTPITATTTATQYKIRITPRSHAAMPVPPGSSYAVTAFISDWVGAGAHAGSDSGGTTVTIDNLSPGEVTASSATAGNAQVALSWTNPGDADLGSIVVLRRASAAVADVPAEDATYVVGNTIGSATVACVVTAPTANCTDTGLTNGTPYHYKNFARDSNGNYATGVVPTGSPATPQGDPIITVTKFSVIISDPVNGAANPKRIPGAVVEYGITLANTGNGSPDADSVYAVDAIDQADLAFDAGTGVTFTDGATSSGLSLGSVTYSSTPAPGPYLYDYTPVPDIDGYDRNITSIKVTTTGSFAFGGTPAAGFSLKYRVKVK